MRLTVDEITAIKSAVLSHDPAAKIYLFGSRADDKSKGGDIDILVISGKLDLNDKITIKTEIYDKIGEQKIDLVIEHDGSKPFTKIAIAGGILL